MYLSLRLSVRSFFLPMACTVCVCFFFEPSRAMTRSEFVQNVKSKNPDLMSLSKIYEAKKSIVQARSEVYDATFFAEAGTLQDQKVQTASAFTYDKLTVNSYQLGVEKIFSFGLQSRLFYKTSQTQIANGSTGTQTFNLNVWESSPAVELQLPLMANGFGKQFQKANELEKARLEMEMIEADFGLDQRAAEAEFDFVKAQLAQDQLKVQVSALARVSDIYNLIKKKAERNLQQESNLLQTKAVVELTRIEFATTKINAELAVEKLSKWTDIDRQASLSPYDFKDIKEFETQKYRNKKPASSLILESSFSLAALSSEIEIEKQKSELNIVANHTLNGTDDSLNSSMNRAQRGTNPTTYIGLRFRTPLGIEKRGRRADANQMNANALSRRKTYQDQLAVFDFKDLESTFERTKELLEMSFLLEKAQQEKLRNEKKLLSQGRSSIYQVLQFELDFTRAQSSKFQYALQLETLKNQIQLYKY